MAVMAEDRTYFENEDWAVDGQRPRTQADRVFHRKGRDREPSRRTGCGRGPCTWPRRAGATAPAFTLEAFTCAAQVTGLRADANLARSFKMARCEIAVPAASRTQKASRKSMPGFDAERSRVLAGKRARPHLLEAGGAGQSASHSNRLASLPQDRLRTRESGHGYALPSMARARSGRTEMGRNAPWRASRHIRKAGTQIVRLLWAAWSIR